MIKVLLFQHPKILCVLFPAREPVHAGNEEYVLMKNIWIGTYLHAKL